MMRDGAVKLKFILAQDVLLWGVEAGIKVLFSAVCGTDSERVLYLPHYCDTIALKEDTRAATWFEYGPDVVAGKSGYVSFSLDLERCR